MREALCLAYGRYTLFLGTALVRVREQQWAGGGADCNATNSGGTGAPQKRDPLKLYRGKSVATAASESRLKRYHGRSSPSNFCNHRSSSSTAAFVVQSLVGRSHQQLGPLASSHSQACTRRDHQEHANQPRVPMMGREVEGRVPVVVLFVGISPLARRWTAMLVCICIAVFDCSAKKCRSSRNSRMA